MRTFSLLCSLSQLSYPFLGPALPKQMGNWRDGEKKTPQNIKHKPPNKGDKSSFFFLSAGCSAVTPSFRVLRGGQMNRRQGGLTFLWEVLGSVPSEVITSGMLA